MHVVCPVLSVLPHDGAGRHIRYRKQFPFNLSRAWVSSAPITLLKRSARQAFQRLRTLQLHPDCYTVCLEDTGR
jgi:hypothetical protein